VASRKLKTNYKKIIAPGKKMAIEKKKKTGQQPDSVIS